MTTKSRFTTAIATGAVLLNALAPVALASEGSNLNIVGNGANSTSEISVNKTSATVVNQTNSANITNNVSSNASTGGNNANYNTGGDVRIVTGDAKTKVDVSNAVNLNKASVDCGACSGGPYDVKIKGNGAFSENEVELNKDNTVFLDQNNDANITNDVHANAKTGDNEAGFNTGGDVVIVTGDAKTKVDVDNKANANFAKIGGGQGSDGSSVKIKGNGAFSDNDVDLNETSAIVLSQYNNANISNDVDANAKTGDNESEFNTGGEVAISTGDAKTKVGVDNLVNFNFAEVDCDCVLGDLDVKVKGNGAFSENEVEANADNALFNDQNNDANLYNDVEGKAKTGYNEVEFSTGSAEGGDPLIWTGDANSETGVSSAGNVNIFNNGDHFHLPGDWELGVNWDLSDLWNLLQGWN